MSISLCKKIRIGTGLRPFHAKKKRRFVYVGFILYVFSYYNLRIEKRRYQFCVCVCVCVCVVYRGTWLCNCGSNHERLFQVISLLSPSVQIAFQHCNSFQPSHLIRGYQEFQGYRYGWVIEARSFRYSCG